jgi:hypothetical protein
MNEFLSKFNAGEIIALVAVTGGLLIPLVCGVTKIIFDGWFKVRQLALKQDMLNRGMSADEIRIVLDAGSRASRKAQLKTQSCRSE